MRLSQTPNGGLKLWLSANDTYQWATRPGASWPCSALSNRRLFAEFEANGDLVDLVIDGGRGEQDCPGDELNAIATDHIASRFPDHPAVRGEPQAI